MFWFMVLAEDLGLVEDVGSKGCVCKPEQIRQQDRVLKSSDLMYAASLRGHSYNGPRFA